MVRSQSLIRRIEQAEQALRAPDFLAVRRAVRALRHRRLGRELRLRVARLAYDSQLPGLAVSLLRPAIHGAQGKRASATPSELVLYALARNVLSPSREAVRLLSRLDLGALPHLASQVAFAHFRLWDWTTPRPALERALRRPELTAASRADNMTLLAVSLIHGRPTDLARAEALAREAHALATGLARHGLVLDCSQILAQSLLFQQKGREAERVLDEALGMPATAGSRHYVPLLRQWREIAGLQDAPRDRARRLRELRAIEARFHALGLHEFARRCRFSTAQALGDVEELAFVYFGTPYEGCKAKVIETLERFGRSAADLPAAYELRLGARTRAGGLRLDVFSGENDGPVGGRLKPGQLTQVALSAVAGDFFEQPNIYRLDETLYPDEEFDPERSYTRVAQALERLRAWLGRERLPLAVVEDRGRYRLEAGGPVILRIPRHDASLPPRVRDFIERARASFGGEWFRSSQVQQLLAVSDWTARELLRGAVQLSLLRREGAGAGTRYRLRDS